MLIYIFFSLHYIGACVLEKTFKNKKINVLLLSSILLCFFIIGSFKGVSVGIDTVEYNNIYYQTIHKYSFTETLLKYKPEVLFYSILYLFSKFGLSKVFFDCFCYFVICLFIFLSFFKKNRPCFYSVTFLSIMFFALSLSIIRQAIASAIVLFAITILMTEIKKVKKYIIYFGLIILAATFHSTALFLIILPIFQFIKIKKYQFPWPSLFFIFLPFLCGRLYGYAYLFINDYYKPASSRFPLTLIVVIALIWFIYLFYLSSFSEKISSKLKLNISKTEELSFLDSNHLILLYLFAFFTCFNTASMVATRLTLYFIIGVSYFLVFIEEKIQNKIWNNLVFAFELLALTLYSIYYCNISGAYPYVFI